MSFHEDHHGHDARLPLDADEVEVGKQEEACRGFNDRIPFLKSAQESERRRRSIGAVGSAVGTSELDAFEALRASIAHLKRCEAAFVAARERAQKAAAALHALVPAEPE